MMNKQSLNQHIMKKQILLTAAAVAVAISASAQASVVKDAERAAKDGKDAAQVLTIITPAFSDPETATQALTYYVPGKAFYSEYDNLFGLKQFNKLPENGDKTMSDDLIQGYELLVKALPLDTVVDAKGKVKTKHSKDIVATVTGHVSDLNSAAVAYWGLQEYANAYKAWDIFLNLYETEPFAATLAKSAPHDTILGEVAYNQALAAWQADMLPQSLKAFDRAKAKGYSKKQMYDYALAVANNANNQDAVFSWAEAALALYPEDPTYLGFIINTYLQNKEFDKAFATINKAIDTDPNNAQYYLIKGILYDNQEKKPEAKDAFAKAIALDGENTGALTQYGAALCQEAYTLSDQAPTTPDENAAFYTNRIRPLFEEAATYLEKAWKIDMEKNETNNQEALRYLENIYYNLQDEAKQADVEARKSY